jgi:hypothetical protein
LSTLNLFSAQDADDGRNLKGGPMPTHLEVIRLNLEYYRKQAEPEISETNRAGKRKAKVLASNV